MCISPRRFLTEPTILDHCRVEDSFLRAVEHFISPIGNFYMNHIVWAGNYAANEKGEKKNLYRLAEDIKNDMIPNANTPYSEDTTIYRYIVNHTNGMYVDKERIAVGQKHEKDSFIIHPLPLLVSEGNGKSHGDYFGNNAKLCGRWARDVISVEKSIPNGFEELVCNFYV